ncbi:MAG: hypothetical protein OSB62_06540 [Alphaproteobacteria bacterium]|nr:hypothetical protein [Alphaproteobacteria bacterium]
MLKLFKDDNVHILIMQTGQTEPAVFLSTNGETFQGLRIHKFNMKQSFGHWRLEDVTRQEDDPWSKFSFGCMDFGIENATSIEVEHRFWNKDRGEWFSIVEDFDLSAITLKPLPENRQVFAWGSTDCAKDPRWICVTHDANRPLTPANLRIFEGECGKSMGALSTSIIYAKDGTVSFQTVKGLFISTKNGQQMEWQGSALELVDPDFWPHAEQKGTVRILI